MFLIFKIAFSSEIERKFNTISNILSILHVDIQISKAFIRSYDFWCDYEMRLRQLSEKFRC